jgi:hypothetical protein
MEFDRPAPLEINVTRDVGDHDAETTVNIVLAEVAAKLRDRFLYKTPANPDNETPEKVTVHVVVLHPDTYGDLKETEWMYKDLAEPAEDNAQEDEE